MSGICLPIVFASVLNISMLLEHIMSYYVEHGDH